MPTSNKIEAKDYYKNLPAIEHETGDIWSGFPSWGMTDHTTTSAIVITPACDLSQKKSETVTVLPIITITDYLYSKSFYSELWNEFNSKLKDLERGDILPESRFSNPPTSKLREVLNAIEGIAKQKKLYTQLLAYIEYINYVETKAEERKQNAAPNISNILGAKKFSEILKKIFTNSYKSDIHFFPAYKNAGEFSAIPAHSVALFRYAHSVPIDILNAAQTSSDAWWEQDKKALTGQLPMIDNFKEWPIKLSTLKDDFLSDLLSRYLGMFMRLGSRDFTEHTICGFVSELTGGN